MNKKNACGGKKIKNIDIDKKPKVLAVEWLEPFFTAGHWVPEMIEIAGGENMISKIGEHSRRMKFEEISNADADIIILMPCGFDTKRTVSEYKNTLEKDEKWNNLKAIQNDAVFAVDANSFFSKPSIRTIEGIEILASIIHPDKFDSKMNSKNSFVKISTRN